LDPNWNFIIIGAVILVAVILDQVAHMLEASRRTRRVAETPGALPAESPAPLP
jgi:ribose transport system permease protein